MSFWRMNVIRFHFLKAHLDPDFKHVLINVLGIRRPPPCGASGDSWFGNIDFYKSNLSLKEAPRPSVPLVVGKRWYCGLSLSVSALGKNSVTLNHSKGSVCTAQSTSPGKKHVQKVDIVPKQRQLRHFLWRQASIVNRFLLRNGPAICRTVMMSLIYCLFISKHAFQNKTPLYKDDIRAEMCLKKTKKTFLKVLNWVWMSTPTTNCSFTVKCWTTQWRRKLWLPNSLPW